MLHKISMIPKHNILSTASFCLGGDLSDGEREMPASASPAPVSYAAQTSTPPNVPVDPTADTLVSSTETLLRNIQGLLKVAADNARQQERQISYEKGRTFEILAICRRWELSIHRRRTVTV